MLQDKRFLITGISDAGSLALHAAKAIVEQGGQVVCAGLGVTPHHTDLSDKAQAYRSEEQKYTDKRQATGYQLAGPVPFGTFEVGRGSMPGNDRNTAVFMDGMMRGLVHPHPDGHTAVQVGE